MTLYELIKQNGGLDIGDNIYDWGNYFDFSDDENDHYDRCMIIMAKEIEVEKINLEWFSCCKITEYLEKRKDTFTDFMNTFYDEMYKPINVENETDEFFDYYIDLFTTLINGGWSDREYKWLADRLEKENYETI